MLSDYFNGKKPKFDFGDYVYISTHKKYGVVTGIEYNPYPKNTFHYAVVHSLKTYFQYFKEGALNYIASMKCDTSCEEKVTLLYCKSIIDKRLFAQYAASFYPSQLNQGLVQVFEAKEKAYCDKKPGFSFISYVIAMTQQGYYQVPLSIKEFSVQEQPILKLNNSSEIKSQPRTWLRLP